MNDINYILQKHEYPQFDKHHGWASSTIYGMVWRLFPDDERQFDEDIYNEAVYAVRKIIETKQPLCGGWK